MVLTFHDWHFDADITKTMTVSGEESAEHCMCGACRNFYRTVDNAYPNLRTFLSQFGLDLEAPDELIPCHENGEVWLLKTDEIIKSDGDDIQNSYKEKETSVIILSDEIPKSRSNGYGDWFHHDDSFDDCSSRYEGYNGYDDDTIDSAFEGNPELTWNID